MRAGDILARLEKRPGALRLSMQEGQVLVYEGHVPMGLFVLVSGSVEWSDEGAVALVTVDRGGRPVIISALDDLDEPSKHGVVLRSKGDFLFLPRTVVRSSRTVRALLRDLASGERPSP